MQIVCSDCCFLIMYNINGFWNEEFRSGENLWKNAANFAARYTNGKHCRPSKCEPRPRETAGF